MNRKRVLAFALASAMVISLSACGQEDSTQVAEAPSIPQISSFESEMSVEVSEEPENVDTNHDGQARDYLTGQWIDEEIAQQRPVAIMVGNTKDALPQHGLSKAEVIYEAPVEAEITRLMPIFQDHTDIEGIGGVRSCRLYFAEYSLEFDALYVHYGQAYLAEDFLNSDRIDNLSGLNYDIEPYMFYRVNYLKSPHNAYTSTEGIDKGASMMNYRTTYNDSYTGHYQFADDNETITLENGSEATTVYPGYSTNKAWFEYNADEGLYYRYQYGQAHIDGANNEQLYCTNILMEITDVSTADATTGYLDVRTTGEGRGWYFTKGKAIPITWKRDNLDSQTKYYDENGDEITLNQGKTWVCIINSDKASELTFN